MTGLLEFCSDDTCDVNVSRHRNIIHDAVWAQGIVVLLVVHLWNRHELSQHQGLWLKVLIMKKASATRWPS
jgi:uncharacterized membrane protein YiaA